MKSFQVVYTEESELTRTFVYRVQAESAEEAEEKVRHSGYVLTLTMTKYFLPVI